MRTRSVTPPPQRFSINPALVVPGAVVQMRDEPQTPFRGRQVHVKGVSPDNRNFLVYEKEPVYDKWVWWDKVEMLVSIPDLPAERKILLYVPATPEAERPPPPPRPKPLPAPIHTIEPEPPKPKPIRMTPAELATIPESPPSPPLPQVEVVEVVPVTREIREEPMQTQSVVPDYHNDPFMREGTFFATDVDPVTKAEKLKTWMASRDLNSRQAAALLKKSTATVDNYLKLLEAPAAVLVQVRSGDMKMYTALNALAGAKFAEPAPEPQPTTPPPPPPIDPAPLPPAALATIPEPVAPLARADEVEALYRMVQSLKGEIATLVDNLVETPLPPAPLAPLVQPAAPTSIIINITVQDGGVVTIKQ